MLDHVHHSRTCTAMTSESRYCSCIHTTTIPWTSSFIHHPGWARDLESHIYGINTLRAIDSGLRVVCSMCCISSYGVCRDGLEGQQRAIRYMCSSTCGKKTAVGPARSGPVYSDCGTRPQHFIPQSGRRLNVSQKA